MTEISVIVPVHDVAAHVGPCLESLRRQSFADFEVIVIDDGATDGSGDVAQEAIGDDPRFRLIRQENRGLSGARNAGLDLAQGALIAFVDSDDRVMPDYLARLRSALVAQDADWVACALRSCFPDGAGHVHSAIHGAADPGQHLVPRRHAFTDWCAVIRHFPSAWNKLYTRRLIEGLRFDEGTWFEDHSFFLRAAARTDHLLHLPDALYLQTRGRPGQITAADDDRVFEQLPVLTRMGEILKAGPHGRADEAYARIASRLVFERSTALRDPARRARFARDAAAFLKAQGLDYTPGWDPDIARSWGREMAGETLLSVVLAWDGRDDSALTISLDGLAAQSGPAFELLLVCPASAVAKARAAAPAAQVIACPASDGHGGRGAAWQRGLAAARTPYIQFLGAGDVLLPFALLTWIEAALACDADMTVAQFRIGTGPEALPHDGFADPGVLPGTPATGALELPPETALALAPDIQNRLFRRAFLQEAPLAFTSGARPGWALGLGAALLAGRAAYIAETGVALARFDPGGRRGGGVGLAHARLLRALPPEARALLPQGWPRRLFARALRDEVDTALPGPRLPRARRLAAIALAGQLRGYGGTYQDPAGFDPAFGPRLARLLHPASLLGAPALLPAPRRPDRHAETCLFVLKSRAMARFRVDFHDHDYANLSFLAGDGPQVALHLSLRLREQLAVTNDSHPDGLWRAERQRPFALSRLGHAVTIEITPPRARILIDGQPVFDLQRRLPWRRGGFVALDRITRLAVEGGYRATDLMPEAPGAALMLDPRLMLRAAQAHAGQVLLDPHGAALLLTDAPLPGGAPGLAACPSGRIWQDAGDAVTFTLGAQHLTLTRQDMAARIAAMLQAGLGPGDPVLAARALDHLRHGALLELLPGPARAAAGQLAAAMGLPGQLSTGAKTGKSSETDPDTAQNAAVPPAPLAPKDPVTAQIETALMQFTHSQRADPPADPGAVLAGLALPRPARQGLFLALSEHFCTTGAKFEVLYDAARQEDLHMFDPTGKDVWSRSAMLPFLLCAGLFDTLEQTLDGLAQADPDTGWVLTAPLAWTVRAAQTRAGLPDDLRDKTLLAYQTFIWQRARRYWDRAHCAELTRTAVWLVTRLARDDDMRQTLQHFCIAIYGLSRRFWTMLRAEGGAIPADLAQAAAHFETVQAQNADPEALHSALRFFEDAGNRDAARIRRDRLGPSGLPLPPGTAPDRAQLITRSLDPVQAALRHMASPGAAEVAPEVAELVAEGLPALYPDVPRARRFGLQIRMANRIEEILSAPDRLNAGETETVLADLALLSGDGDGFLGIGLGLTLAAAQIGDGRAADPASKAVSNPVTNLVTDWCLAQIAALPDSARPLLQRAAALEAALPRLAALDHPQARALLSATGADPAALPAPEPGSPLYDTVVTVFSCAAHLDSRIPELRAGWLRQLEDLGVPYLVMVGDGDGTRSGDIVRLQAPDDYEGLPQKSLAAIDWVHRHTGHAHMLKIDDDCFLNAPLFFRSLSFRKHAYYGRKLTRIPGQMDRAWHQAKSRSARGRQELDRSPEPSDYADGGSAYALSRSAMAAALDAARSATGQRLIADSFMEDKMLGDLLALRGIHVSEEDYRISIRRRPRGCEIPVPAWLNSFLPSRAAPLQLAHLDRTEDQASALHQLDQPTLRRRKIWPSFQDAALGYQSNALELISPEARVARAREAEVALVACMRNEMFLLRPFLDHYRSLGVDAFLIADNGSDDGTLEFLAEQEDVAVFSVDTDYRRSAFGVAWQQALLAAFRLHRWSIVADADELLVWQRNQTQTLPDLLQTPEFAQAEAARIFMLDMYPEGALSEVTFASGDPFAEAGFADRIPFLTGSPMRGPYSDQPAWTSALRHRLLPGSAPNLFTAQKLALLRYHPFMRLSAGLHFVGDARIAPRELIFGHFKYNADFHRKAQAEVARGQHWGNAEEYRKYLALASEGRAQIHDPALSARWDDVPFVADRLG